MHRQNAHRLCISAAITAMLGLLLFLAAGCSTTATVPDDDDGAFLELDVEPASAKIYIDGDYEGVVEAWHQQVVPIAPGQRRLKLRADGYISQRFDLDVEEGRWLTLRARLEPAIELPDEDDAGDDAGDDEDTDSPMPTPDHPTAPEP